MLLIQNYSAVVTRVELDLKPCCEVIAHQQGQAHYNMVAELVY